MLNTFRAKDQLEEVPNYTAKDSVSVIVKSPAIAKLICPAKSVVVNVDGPVESRLIILGSFVLVWPHSGPSKVPAVLP